MKEITKEQLILLEERGIIRNTRDGYVDRGERKIGFYKTRHKSYAEDKYVNIANKIKK